MYQVLYRKWRPKTFSDVSGQDAVTATLKNELKSGRLAHAYLFTGSRGTGKTTCAKILAKAANCLHPVDGDPCNECEICKGIEQGTVMDIEEIDAAPNNGVDNIRALREEVHFTPTAGKFRVYIIDEVHMLSVGAFNALLKTLEEPPEHVIFILATTEVHKVPATVLSRCQRFDFGRISDDAIVARLQYVADHEPFTLDPDAAVLIARLAEGGMRDALSILDRCAGVDHISVERVNAIVGLAGNETLFSLSDALAKGDLAGCLQVVEQLYRNTGDMTRLCDQLLHHFRNVMLAKAVENPADLIAGNPSDVRQYMNTATAVSMEEIMQVINALQTARERMRTGANGRVELEMALLSLSLPAAPAAAPAVKRAQPAAPQPVPQPEPVREPPSQPAPAPSAADELFPRKPEQTVDVPWFTEEDKQIAKNEDAAEKYREEKAALFMEEPPLPEEMPFMEEPSLPEEPVAAQPPVPAPAPVAETGMAPFTPWPQVIEALAPVNRMMAATLKGSDAFLENGIVLIRSKNAQFVDLIRQANNRADVRDAIAKVTGQTYRLGPYKEPVSEKTDPLQAFVANMQGKIEINNMDKF
ncbi:MAG: DNA polymerase III subunit gamma/tau [Clostridia bacterium]|nr:DNA polymerase III subunit gamma/tau [Clostridia bacterium]